MIAIGISTEKCEGTVVANGKGGVKVYVAPRDYKANGAAEVEITRTRHDDGSVTVDVTPKT